MLNTSIISHQQSHLPIPLAATVCLPRGVFDEGFCFSDRAVRGVVATVDLVARGVVVVADRVARGVTDRVVRGVATTVDLPVRGVVGLVARGVVAVDVVKGF